MSIVTKTGDKGETFLMYGRRVSKTDPRVEAYGSVDELNAAFGLARALAQDAFVSGQILAAQKDLIVLMGELATVAEDRSRFLKDGFKLIVPEMTERIGAAIDELEKDKNLYPKDWVIPGGNAASAAIDLARTAARRAERQVVALKDVNPEIVRYLNRLSDLCWLLARYAEKQAGTGAQKSPIS